MQANSDEFRLINYASNQWVRICIMLFMVMTFTDLGNINKVHAYTTVHYTQHAYTTCIHNMHTQHAYTTVHYTQHFAQQFTIYNSSLYTTVHYIQQFTIHNMHTQHAYTTVH